MIKQIGVHRVSDACITSNQVDELMAGMRARVLYSDPPWGDGNLKYWATINERMTGRRFSPLTYSQLLSRLKDLIQRYVTGHVFIETGKRFVDRALADFKPVINRAHAYKIKYRSGSRFIENYLIHGWTNDSGAAPFDFDPTGMAGYSVVERCIHEVSLPQEIVFDPCCGMGYSARAAVNAGMRFFGNEFNTARLEKTILFLNSHAK